MTSDTRRAILDALAEGPRSGADLAEDLGVSRAAVWKHVEALRDRGFEIESGPEGYALADVPEYGAEAVHLGLDAPFDVHYRERVPSTNDVARDLAADGAEDVVVLADEQTGGRGRLDREWASPSGGIWLSVLLRPERPPATMPLYTLAMAVAVTTAAREAGVDAGIKWPNDVLVSERQRPRERSERGRESCSPHDGVSRNVSRRTNEGSPDERGESSGIPVSEPRRTNEGSPDEQSESSGVPERESGQDPAESAEAKLAGVLTEMEGEADRVEWLVVGTGINANVDADELPANATSLRDELGEDVNRRLYVQRVLETFDDLRSDPDAILEAWRADALTLGRTVRIETAGGDEVVGTAVDVEHPGTLLVETADGTERVHAGDCEHLRPA